MREPWASAPGEMLWPLEAAECKCEKDDLTTMQEMVEWWAQIGGADRQWLVMADGPTLGRREEFDLSRYARIALGPSALVVPSDAVIVEDAHAADADLSLAGVVLAPRALASSPSLRSFEAAGRLVAYDPPSLAAGGAASAIGLLGSLGACTVRTLGVDLNPSAPPAPVPAGADQMADAIAAAMCKYRLDCGPLTCELPARVFIGADASQMLGAKILEYTVRRHSTISVVFDTMQSVRTPVPKDPKNQARTEFSFHRFAIPKLAGYAGRGLYVDADMQVFHDFRELWEMPFDGDSTVMYAPPSSPKRTKQTSVMLLDCSRLRWNLDDIVRDLDEGRYDYHSLMQDIALEPADVVRPGIPTDWNSLEEYVPGRTRLLHYTDTNTQPWVSRRNRNGCLWMKALCEAMADGSVTEAEIQEAVQVGNVRPSLPLQLRVKPERWPMFCRVVAPILDARYKPHRKLRQRLGSKPL